MPWRTPVQHDLDWTANCVSDPGQDLARETWVPRLRAMTPAAAAGRAFGFFGFQAGRVLGSPKRGRTLVPNRVIAWMREPARVMTKRPLACRMPA